MKGVIIEAKRKYEHYNKLSPKEISNPQLPYPLGTSNTFLSPQFTSDFSL
jgi:hypothetical protein